MLETQELFEARTGGYKTYRIPGLVVTPGGAVLATTEARRGDGGDYDANDVLLRRSTDGGRTWSEPRVQCACADYGPGPMDNYCLIADLIEDTTHALFFHDYARVFYQRSDDDGLTFTDPVNITSAFEGLRDDYPWAVIAGGPGHGTQLTNGRLVVPLWMSDGSGTEMGQGHRGHRPSAVSSIYSDDHGRTWQAGEVCLRHLDEVAGETVLNPSETIMAELSDGRVMFNVRTESDRHRRLVALSPDGATGWSNLHFDEVLLEPVCMASLIRADAPGEAPSGRLVFANPANLEKDFAPPTGPARARKNLTIRLSEDDGRTWSHSRVLEPGPAGYSDLAVLPDGTILCLYECGVVDRMYDDKCLRLARFGVGWVQTCARRCSPGTEVPGA